VFDITGQTHVTVESLVSSSIFGKSRVQNLVQKPAIMANDFVAFLTLLQSFAKMGLINKDLSV
jgi:hypothetical protein